MLKSLLLERTSTTGKLRMLTLLVCFISQKICSNDYERYFNVKQDHELEKCLDVNAIVRLCQPAIKNGKKISASLGISNTDRVCGTILSSEITKVYGVEGLPEDTINLEFVGSAGQSFGCIPEPWCYNEALRRL